MKLLISGSRSLNDTSLISKAIGYAGISLKDITEIVHGGSTSIDTAAGWWAENHNIKLKVFKADWKNLKTKGAIVAHNGFGEYNKKAGITRNKLMGRYADVLVAIWDGQSKGTQHMIFVMEKLEKEFWVYEI